MEGILIKNNWVNTEKAISLSGLYWWYRSVLISFDRTFCEVLAVAGVQHFREREKVIKGQNNGKDLKNAEKRVKKAEKKFKRLRDEEAESTKEER